MFLLQVSHHMATPDAQAEAKGEALEDDSKSNTIPEVGLKYSLDITWHHMVTLLIDEMNTFFFFYFYILV